MALFFSKKFFLFGFLFLALSFLVFFHLKKDKEEVSLKETPNRSISSVAEKPHALMSFIPIQKINPEFKNFKSHSEEMKKKLVYEFFLQMGVKLSPQSEILYVEHRIPRRKAQKQSPAYVKKTQKPSNRTISSDFISGEDLPPEEDDEWCSYLEFTSWKEKGLLEGGYNWNWEKFQEARRKGGELKAVDECIPVADSVQATYLGFMGGMALKGVDAGVIRREYFQKGMKGTGRGARVVGQNATEALTQRGGAGRVAKRAGRATVRAGKAIGQGTKTAVNVIASQTGYSSPSVGQVIKDVRNGTGRIASTPASQVSKLSTQAVQQRMAQNSTKGLRLMLGTSQVLRSGAKFGKIAKKYLLNPYGIAVALVGPIVCMSFIVNEVSRDFGVGEKNREFFREALSEILVIPAPEKFVTTVIHLAYGKKLGRNMPKDAEKALLRIQLVVAESKRMYKEGEGLNPVLKEALKKVDAGLVHAPDTVTHLDEEFAKKYFGVSDLGDVDKIDIHRLTMALVEVERTYSEIDILKKVQTEAIKRVDQGLVKIPEEELPLINDEFVRKHLGMNNLDEAIAHYSGQIDYHVEAKERYWADFLYDFAAGYICFQEEVAGAISSKYNSYFGQDCQDPTCIP